MQNGALAVFSPTAYIPAVEQTVQALGGNVGYIVATDIEHHIFISEWARAFPNAKVLGMEGLPEKREANPETKGTTFHHVWTAKNKADFKVDPAFDAEFDHEFIPAHGNKELVFLHKPDRTLIEADLIFMLPATEQYSKAKSGATDGLWTKLFIKLMSAEGSAVWQKRFIWYAASARDRPDFNKSVRRIDSWDFDRIIPCHGDVVETGGKGIFRKVLEWHLQGMDKN
jgi:hypothetical protein